MGATDLHGIEATGVHKILCMLGALRQSQTGNVIYRQVERMLEDVVNSHQTIERTYITLVNQLLDAYIGQLRAGSPLQVQVRLLQTRLEPPLTAADLQALQDYVELYSNQIDALQQMDAGLFRNAVEPLLKTFGISQEAHKETQPLVSAPEVESEQAVAPDNEAMAEQIEPEPEPEPGLGTESEMETGFEKASAESEPDSQWPFASADETNDIRESAPEEASATNHNTQSDFNETGINAGKGESQVDTAYRSHLDSKRRDIQKLQATLAQQVLSTIAQNEEFGVLLEVVLGELRQAGDATELEDLRWTLIREIEKLTKGHHELAEKLDSTHHYLQLIESDSRQLNDELTRVRLLSLTDELTGLPNRRAFLRRIEDEVARVQRYGFPLSLALIDLDHFKQVNDKYGHAGGDEVLQMYSKNILSIFRHHDLVARYGGEEFAVLLPNTDAEGSMRALTKVRNRALETRWQVNGDMIPVPTFSSGVSLYKPGETASAFIERADKALYRAKRLGRNRVEMDATYQNESETAEPDIPVEESGRKQGES